MKPFKAPYSGRFGNNDESVSSETPETETEQPSEQETAGEQEGQDPNTDTEENQEGQDPNTDTEENQEEQSSSSSNSEQEEAYDENRVLEFLRGKTGKDVKSIDDFLNPKVEEQKEHKPEDEEVSRFAKYKEKHGGSMNDYLALQKDWGKIDDVDVLRDKFQEESKGLDLSETEIDTLIKKKYGLDEFEDLSELSNEDKLSIRLDANRYRKEKSKLQQEVLNSLDNGEAPKENKSQQEGETITLTNGQVVDKEKYLKARKKYEEGRTKAVKDLTEAKFGFDFNNGNGNDNLEFSYQYTEEDKQRMLSMSEDTSKLMQRFINEETGELNHANLNEGLLWSDKKYREEVMIPRLLSQVYSGGIEKQLKESKNVNFDKSSRSSSPKASTKKNKIDLSRLPGGRGFESKFKLNKKK